MKSSTVIIYHYLAAAVVFFGENFKKPARVMIWTSQGYAYLLQHQNGFVVRRSDCPGTSEMN